MLNLSRYLSWLSVLLDKQQNNVGASPGLQLTTFQRRHNLVPSPDNLIALETPQMFVAGPRLRVKNLSLFFETAAFKWLQMLESNTSES